MVHCADAVLDVEHWSLRLAARSARARTATLPWTQRALARDTDVEVRAALAARRHLHSSARAMLLVDESEFVRANLTLTGDPDILTTLSTDPSTVVRGGVARNASAPESVARTLASDGCVDVRRALTLSAFESVQLQLSGDESITLRRELALNPHLSVRVMNVLSHDVLAVRAALAANPALVVSEDLSVRFLTSFQAGRCMVKEVLTSADPQVASALGASWCGSLRELRHALTSLGPA